MNRTNRNPMHYSNNHCTESAIEFFPNLVESQCVHDTTDLCQSDYDDFDEWINTAIDVAEFDDNEQDICHQSMGMSNRWYIGYFEPTSHLFNDEGDLL